MLSKGNHMAAHLADEGHEVSVPHTSKLIYHDWYAYDNRAWWPGNTVEMFLQIQLHRPEKMSQTCIPIVTGLPSWKEAVESKGTHFSSVCPSAISVTGTWACPMILSAANSCWLKSTRVSACLSGSWINCRNSSCQLQKFVIQFSKGRTGVALRRYLIQQSNVDVLWSRNTCLDSLKALYFRWVIRDCHVQASCVLDRPAVQNGTETVFQCSICWSTEVMMSPSLKLSLSKI